MAPCRAYEKQQGKFEVEFDGDPLPTVSWFREDFPIQNSADFQIHTFSTKSILAIREVFMEDSGIFSAVAENRGGKAKCSANLVVEKKKGTAAAGPPNFLQTIQDQKVRPGQTVRVEAKIGGLKPLDVYWLKDGTKLDNSKRVKLSQAQETYAVTITESVPEDSGKIECVAMNSAGEARCEAEIEVVSPVAAPPAPKPTPEGPKVENVAVTQPLQAVVVKEGQPAVFKCRVSGKPVPTATWTKGPKVLSRRSVTQLGLKSFYKLILTVSVEEIVSLLTVDDFQETFLKTQAKEILEAREFGKIEGVGMEEPH